MKVVVYPTTSGLLSEDLEEIIYIIAVEDSRRNCALTNSVGEAESGGEHSVPSDIGKLESVDDDQDSEKDFRELGINELEKENRMMN